MNIVLSHYSALECIRYRSINGMSVRATERFLDIFPEGEVLDTVSSARVRELVDAMPWLSLPLHLAVPSRAAAGPSIRVEPHSLPRELAFYRAVPLISGAFCSSSELMFVQLAELHSFEELLLLGCELCGTYRRDVAGGWLYHRPRVATPARLAACALSSLHVLPHASLAQQASSCVVAGSASLQQTRLALMLSLPCEHGGFGLEKPRLNDEVIYGESQKRCSLDFFWPQWQKALEFESDRHQMGTRCVTDQPRLLRSLQKEGIAVKRVSNKQARSLEGIKEIVSFLSDGEHIQEHGTLREWQTRQEQLFIALTNVR